MKRKLKGVCVSEAQGKVETIPYTKRKHFIVVPYMFERKIGVYVFQKLKGNFKRKFYKKIHPESVRVRMILKYVIEALQRVLKKEGSESGNKLANVHLEGVEMGSFGGEER
ncbi:hypothetical protein HanLR1_Chr01g0006631 [Helianthus annuus]|nr:hypothetical protein HanLR1_Chr01g0006631 [Helianthus annuus]